MQVHRHLDQGKLPDNLPPPCTIMNVRKNAEKRLPWRAVEAQTTNKRRRLDIRRQKTPELYLCDLNRDILIYLMHFLPFDDLGNFAVVSRQCADARNHFSLDQTRMGSIIIHTGTLRHKQEGKWNAEKFLERAYSRKWDNAFQGRRTRLRIVGLELVEPSKLSRITRLAKRVQLENVTSLDVSFTSSLDARHRRVKNSVVKTLALMLPRLKELDVSYMKVTPSAMTTFAKTCPDLEVFRWTGSDDALDFSGKNFTMCKNLKGLYLDGSRLYHRFRHSFDTPFLVDEEYVNNFLADHHILLSSCNSRLERVSIKRCKYFSWTISASHPLGQGPDTVIAQDAMKRFVLNTPTLRWFQSDLSPGNVQLLRKKCPNVEFC